MGLARAALALVLAAWPGLALAFTIGVLPIHSSRVLVERYEPLRAYLERHLKEPVRIESAPDFARFHARSLRGDFDLTITASHFARIAQKDAGLQPLVQFMPDHDALLIHHAERPLAGPGDLRGGQLAVIDRLAISVTATLSYLREQGLEAGRDFTASEHRSHASVVHAVGSGVARAAVTTSQGLLQIPEDLRGKLLVFKHIADIPAFVFLAKADLGKPEAERLRTLLLAFPREEEGMKFLAQTGYSGLHPAGEKAMKRADAYLKETRKALKP
jgi:phosphonate transport system substrate-binding protein